MLVESLYEAEKGTVNVFEACVVAGAVIFRAFVCPAA
jgi:hypothetical protein